MIIKALGGCCKKSMANFENAVEAAKLCGLNSEVEHITDTNEIMSMGVISTPGLVINNKVVATGRLLKVNQIVELIEKFNNEE